MALFVIYILKVNIKYDFFCQFQVVYKFFSFADQLLIGDELLVEGNDVLAIGKVAIIDVFLQG